MLSSCPTSSFSPLHQRYFIALAFAQTLQKLKMRLYIFLYPRRNGCQTHCHSQFHMSKSNSVNSSKKLAWQTGFFLGYLSAFAVWCYIHLYSTFPFGYVSFRSVWFFVFLSFFFECTHSTDDSPKRKDRAKKKKRKTPKTI